MAQGLERALANAIAAELVVGLFDDADPANRVVHTQVEPPVPIEAVPDLTTFDDGSTTASLAITVFGDGGEEGQLRLLEVHTITIQCRHPQEEVAWETQRQIFEFLEENGGGVGPGEAPKATGNFSGILIARIKADFQPIRLRRDPSDRDGRFRTSQSFTVRTKNFSFF